MCAFLFTHDRVTNILFVDTNLTKQNVSLKNGNIAILSQVSVFSPSEYSEVAVNGPVYKKKQPQGMTKLMPAPGDLP